VPSPVRIAPQTLERWSEDLLVAAGVPTADAKEVARHLVFADLRGIDTHGTSRLKLYISRLESGAMNARTHPIVRNETPVSALLDGANGLGQVVARRATEIAIAKALALMVEILSGVLTGGPIGPQIPHIDEDLSRPQGIGHFFLAIRPDLFMPEDEFRGRMDLLLLQLRSTPPAEGHKSVLAPGDLEQRKVREQEQLGITIPSSLYRDFEELAERYEVSLPIEFVLG
jgi:LDH2 family malate/lactate/ureidoglycolate dehydrogenase